MGGVRSSEGRGGHAIDGVVCRMLVDSGRAKVVLDAIAGQYHSQNSTAHTSYYATLNRRAYLPLTLFVAPKSSLHVASLRWYLPLPE